MSVAPTYDAEGVYVRLPVWVNDAVGLCEGVPLREEEPVWLADLVTVEDCDADVV